VGGHVPPGPMVAPPMSERTVKHLSSIKRMPWTVANGER